MELNLQNITTAINKLNRCNVATFKDAGDSFVHFTLSLEVESFRHLKDLNVKFQHPVSVISGSNKIGKTSLLILIACSHEKLMKVDSTSPNGDIREHVWKDLINFTSHETDTSDYSYKMSWRVGQSPIKRGEGKRLASSKAWGGLAKKSSAQDRTNAKIRDREVRFIDLERILPARSFSNALYRKANAATKVRLDLKIEKAFSYIFDLPDVKIFQAGKHVNKSCFFIKHSDSEYSSYNAASGEEAIIYLLIDISGTPDNSLILVDEIEAGFHPNIQRKIAKIIQYISWTEKKQFIITTHSPSLMSAFPRKSRIFIENQNGNHRAISGLAAQAVASKMDSIGHPLLTLYCEDDLAAFLIGKILQKLSSIYQYFSRLIQIVESGPVNQVKNDYVRHKRNFSYLRNKVGYAAVFDGDYKDHHDYAVYFQNDSENTCFIYPYEAPEKFLVRSYLNSFPNTELQSALVHTDHHCLFQEMVNLNLATDVSDARSSCYSAFKTVPEFNKHAADLESFLKTVVKHFTEVVVESDEHA